MSFVLNHQEGLTLSEEKISRDHTFETFILIVQSSTVYKKMIPCKDNRNIATDTTRCVSVHPSMLAL